MLKKEIAMQRICYKKLWKLLIDRDLKKKDLQKMAGISASSIAKLSRSENVNTEIIQKKCREDVFSIEEIALNCDVGDVMCMETITEEKVAQDD